MLPMLTGRIPRFELAVMQVVGVLRAESPEHMTGLRVAVADVPAESRRDDGIDRWHALPPDRIVLFRIPIDRLANLHCPDPSHYREHIERCVAEAVAELRGVDPRDVLPRLGDLG